MKTLITKYINIIRYFFIGVSAAAIDIVVFVFLYQTLELPAAVATVFSMSVSMIWGFSLNAFYNFKTTNALLIRFLSYVAVSLMAMTFSALALAYFADHLGHDGVWVKIASLPPIVLLQFLINQAVTFGQWEKKSGCQSINNIRV